jgi:SAM-dependent methyltransferase
VKGLTRPPRLLEGAADAIPLPDASVDVALSSFVLQLVPNRHAALTEIRRVLRPGGRLGLIWNSRDESVDWVARLTEMIDPHRGDTPHFRTGGWRRPFERTPLFGPLHRWRTAHTHQMEAETVVDRVASISFIAALDDVRRDEVCDRVRELIRTHPDLRGRSLIPLPYRTDVYWCEARATR